MKKKIIFTLLGAWLAWPMISQACIYCMMLARNGMSPDDPKGSSYDGAPPQWTPMTMAALQTNVMSVVATNAPVELPKTNSPAVVIFTNGAVLGFDVLAGYPIPITLELGNNTNGAWADAQVNAMIPANIRALDHREFSVDGFMIPAQFEKGKVVEFLLSRTPPACCYGGVPEIHEWIKVRVKPPGVPPEVYNIVRAHGVLSVGAERLDGTLTSIYRLDADKVAVTSEH